MIKCPTCEQTLAEPGSCSPCNKWQSDLDYLHAVNETLKSELVKVNECLDEFATQHTDLSVSESVALCVQTLRVNLAQARARLMGKILDGQ